MLLECDQPFILDKKVNLLNMNRQQLYDFFTLLGEKHFRADQVMKWIYHHYCDDFDNMTNIQQSLRERLKQYAEIRVPIVSDRYCSSDGTIKWCFQIGNQQIETVYIPQKMRATLCISSQIGCLLRCTFCATGQQGFSRNLYVFEIIGQIWCVSKIIKNIGRSVVNFPPITNIVMMGMGEPLLNFNNIVTSIEIMLDDFGFGFSRKRIILSTAGVVPAINKLADRVDVSLAVSLHAPNDLIRSKIMPINKKWNIASLIASIKYYLSKSRINGKFVTIEYVMLDHVNDFISCAYQLVECLKNIPCKINIIPWNSVFCSIYSCSSKKRIDHFVRILLQYGLVTTVRVARGNDINAACGQLVGMVINKRKDIV